MKKTLLVVLLALTLVFSFSVLAMAADEALTVKGDYTAAAKADKVTINVEATGLTVGQEYYLQIGETTGTKVTADATTETLSIEYINGEAWADFGDQQVGEIALMKTKSGEETEDVTVKTVAGPKVKVGRSDNSLTAKVASGQTGFNGVEMSGKTITVTTNQTSVKLDLTTKDGGSLVGVTSPLTVSANTTVKVAAENKVEETYEIKFVKSNVVISEPFAKANGTDAFDVEDGSIAVENGAGSIYVTITGAENMTVTGATKTSGDTYKVAYTAADKDVTVTVKQGTTTVASAKYDLVRPSLKLIYANDDDTTKKADEIEKFSSNLAATYTFDKDWDEIFLLPVADCASKFVKSIEVEGDEVDEDEWYSQKLKKSSYELEIEVTVEVGTDKVSETYTLYLSNEEYEGAEISSFTAGTKKDSDAYLTFVGSKKLYAFIPYEDKGDEIYFQVLTGDDEDIVVYDGEVEEDGDATKKYYESKDLKKVTIEDDYGFISEYEVVVITCDEKKADDNAELDDLELKTGKKESSIKTEVDLTPEFDADTKAYTADVDDDQEYGKITLKTAENTSYVFINGEYVGSGSKKAMSAIIELEDGSNKFEIVVVAEDCESTETYTLTIGAGGTQLKSLTVTGLSKYMSPSFKADSLNYLGYTSAASITMTATAENAACSVTIAGRDNKTGAGSATGTFNLAEGLNVFTVTCYQKGETTTSYSVSIYRIPDAKTIKVSNQNVTVNGAAKTLTAYNINGNNFLQLRDVAMLLNGTSKNFAVDFNDGTQSAYLTSGSAYSANGTENAAISNYTRAAVSTQKFYLDNTLVYPVAFNIDGSNYVMLRDLGVLLNFGITFSGTGSSGTIAINTNTAYVPGK